jgi:CMP-N,N'-diacetyllegionaminic acid synthase
MRILAVVPARGGSKGLPGKNIRPLAGVPLIGHSLRCAAMCPEIHRTIVSTDDPTIADVARSLGADVPFMRPPELALDNTAMMPVLKHALSTIEQQEGRAYDALLLLDPTSPGRLPAEVAQAAALLAEDSDADGVIACSRPTFNPFWVGVVSRDGYARPAFDPDSRYTRRQDVPAFYRINGALYLWRRAFVESSAWPDGNHRLLDMPEARALSIDDEYEFRLAEMLVTTGLVQLPWLTKSPSTKEGSP